MGRGKLSLNLMNLEREEYEALGFRKATKERYHTLIECLSWFKVSAVLLVRISVSSTRKMRKRYSAEEK